MANLEETETYEAGVYQLEVTDQALGGATGVMNTPPRQLANRTKWLKAQVDTMLGWAASFATRTLRVAQAASATSQRVIMWSPSSAYDVVLDLLGYADGEAEASPDAAHLLARLAKTAGSVVDFHLPAPGGELADIGDAEEVRIRLGGVLDWRLVARYLVGEVTRRLALQDGGGLDVLGLHPDGRLLLRQTGAPAAPALTVRRQVPVTAGRVFDVQSDADASAGISWSENGLAIDPGANGRYYFAAIPEVFDADGVVAQLASLKVLGNSASGGISAELQRFDGTTVLQSAVASPSAWGVSDADEKELVATHTSAESDQIYLSIVVPTAKDFRLKRIVAYYKAHRLPA